MHIFFVDKAACKGTKYNSNVFAILLLFLCGCRHQAVEPEPAEIVPSLGAVNISANPHNVLSATVEVRGEHAQSIAIEYDADSLFQESTPLTQAGATSTQLPVLGLTPSTKYFMRVRALSPTGHHATSATQTRARRAFAILQYYSEKTIATAKML